MPDALTVHLNKDGPQSIEVPQAFETASDFDVVLQNHGEPLHVHVRLDQTLSSIATVRTPNRYVEAETTRRIRVAVEDGDRPVDGRIEIVTGFGANTGYISATIRDATAIDETVTVDERLGKPPTSGESPGSNPERILLIAVAIISIFLAGGIAIATQNIVVTVIGVLVMLSVVVATFLLLS